MRIMSQQRENTNGDAELKKGKPERRPEVEKYRNSNETFTRKDR